MMNEIEKYFGYGQARGQARDSDPAEMAFDALRCEINLLSGRVELTMRLLSRIVAKIDPGYLDDPNDPDVQRKSRLLGMSVLKKMQEEALAQAAHDPEQFEKLKRYFAGIQLRGE
jgi:hypothetical protein